MRFIKGFYNNLHSLSINLIPRDPVFQEILQRYSCRDEAIFAPGSSDIYMLEVALSFNSLP